MKKTFFVIFSIIFLDLIGFSIIFPLFPALSEYYLTYNGDHVLLVLFIQCAEGVRELFSLPPSPYTRVVIFGVFMGSLYSLLQFVAAPFWGAISDRWGRKKTLLITTSGLALSYFLWIFSASFGLLLLARTLGGLMAGNISVATAAIADVTSPKNRTKGMALVGVAFALGMILGPAFGGVLGEWDVSERFSSWGLNPFSVPAAFAFLLSLFNVFLVAKKFKETLTPSTGSVQGFLGRGRTANLGVLWRGIPGGSLVNKINGIYFLFICFFSGMEFTLTFLVVERLGYSPRDNAMMFVFIGFLLILVQGVVVRRTVHRVGERKMSCWGMVCVMMGLVIIAFAYSPLALYMGLTFFSVGSGMVVPCLTALASLHSPSQLQGRALGFFRSLGALGRVLGPGIAGLLYWYDGSRGPYLWGAFFLLLPGIFLVRLQLPLVSKEG